MTFQHIVISGYTRLKCISQNLNGSLLANEPSLTAHQAVITPPLGRASPANETFIQQYFLLKTICYQFIVQVEPKSLRLVVFY